jgi:hypothetical protein
LEPGPKPARDPRRPVQCERNKEGSKKYPSPKQSILWLDSALGPQCTCGVYAARVTTPSRRLPSIPTFVWSRSTRATDRSAHSPTGQLFEVFFQTRDGERRRSGCSLRAASRCQLPVPVPTQLAAPRTESAPNDIAPRRRAARGVARPLAGLRVCCTGTPERMRAADDDDGIASSSLTD